MNFKHPVEKLVSEHQERLKSVFFGCFSQGRDYFETVTQIVRILQLNASASVENAGLFSKFWLGHNKCGGFNQFLKVVAGWIIENGFQSIPVIVLQTAYLSFLKKLMRYYNRILIELSLEDSLVIKQAFPCVKQYIQQFSKPYFGIEPRLVFRKSVLRKENEGLCVIFHFFAVQHLFLGKSPTFLKVSQEKQTWDLGIFLIFCRQFGILSQKKGEKKEQKSKIVKIYRRNSEGTMSFEQFLQAINEISHFYAEERRVGVLKDLKVEDERVYFYEAMRFADLLYLKRKMKPFKPAFAPSEAHLRKASDGYRYWISEKKGKKLKDFKEIGKQKLGSKNASLNKIDRKKVLPRVSSIVGIKVNALARVRIHSEKCFKSLKS